MDHCLSFNPPFANSSRSPVMYRGSRGFVGSAARQSLLAHVGCLLPRSLNQLLYSPARLPHELLARQIFFYRIKGLRLCSMRPDPSLMVDLDFLRAIVRVLAVRTHCIATLQRNPLTHRRSARIQPQ